MKIEIRNANRGDLPVLLDFMLKMAEETEGLVLKSEVLQAGIENGLMDLHKANYFMAEMDGQIAGSLMITKEWSDWRNAWVLWIQSVYVRPIYRKQGVYKALYSHIQNLVRATDEYCGIRLYVDNTNTPAQKVYSKLGMNGDHYRLFEWMP